MRGDGALIRDDGNSSAEQPPVATPENPSATAQPSGTKQDKARKSLSASASASASDIDSESEFRLSLIPSKVHDPDHTEPLDESHFAEYRASLRRLTLGLLNLNVRQALAVRIGHQFIRRVIAIAAVFQLLETRLDYESAYTRGTYIVTRVLLLVCYTIEGEFVNEFCPTPSLFLLEAFAHLGSHARVPPRANPQVPSSHPSTARADFFRDPTATKSLLCDTEGSTSAEWPETQLASTSRPASSSRRSSSLCRFAAA